MGVATGSGTKKSSKIMNISQDNINFNTFDASQPASNLNRGVNQKNQSNFQNDDNQVKKS